MNQQPASLNRRQWLAATAAAAGTTALGWSLPAHAQAYPNRPVRLVIGFPPGGTSDIVANLVKEPLGTGLGQPVVLDHRPGAGGVVATQAVTSAPADGHVIGYTSNAFLTVTPHLVDVPYDPLRDIEPVALFGGSVSLLAVSPTLPVNNVAEFLAYAKAHPGQLFYGSSGVATGNHIGSEYFKKQAGFDAVHVPYKGSAAAIADLLAGRLHFIIDPALAPSIAAGKLRGLGVFDAERHPSAALQHLPPVGASVANWNPPRWYNLLTVPKGTPAAVKDRLAQQLGDVLAQPDTIRRLGESSFLAASRSSPDALRQRLAAEHQTMGQLLREARIQPEGGARKAAS